MVVMKRVKTIGATDIEDSTGVGGPLRPMNKNAFVDRIIDSVNGKKIQLTKRIIEIQNCT